MEKLIFTFENGECYIFLVDNHGKKYIDDLVMLRIYCLGYIIFFLDEKTKSATILSLIANKKRCGYGTILLQECIEICKKKQIKIIELDDVTERYRQKNNIYVKYGFQYVHQHGPEMILMI